MNEKIKSVSQDRNTNLLKMLKQKQKKMHKIRQFALKNKKLSQFVFVRECIKRKYESNTEKVTTKRF